MTIVSFANADDIADRFFSLLGRHGINPPIRTPMENELLSLTHLLQVTRNPGLAEDRVSVLRAAAGLHDFAAKVLAAEPLPDFGGFISHLRLIADPSAVNSSIIQNADSAYNDDTARKMAELYVGCLAVHVGREVELDSPTASKGDNPDVMFTVDECSIEKRAQRWAIAIKTISSKQGQTIFERIQDGADQINRCNAEKGLVLINAKNALAHDLLWSTVFSTEGDAVNELARQLNELAESANENRSQEEWNSVLSGKSVRPVVFLGQSLVRLQGSGGQQVPTSLKLLNAYPAQGTLDVVGVGLTAALNKFMQTILLGIPGRQGLFPH